MTPGPTSRHLVAGQHEASVWMLDLWEVHSGHDQSVKVPPASSCEPEPVVMSWFVCFYQPLLLKLPDTPHGTFPSEKELMKRV